MLVNLLLILLLLAFALVMWHRGRKWVLYVALFLAGAAMSGVGGIVGHTTVTAASAVMQVGPFFQGLVS